MNSTGWLQFLWVKLFIFALAIPAFAFASEGPPNILFIYTDDQSHRTVSCYPESYDWVQTPHIDSLATSGVRFAQAYIGTWCMPSRATMLTGRHQHGIESMRMLGPYPGSAYDPDLCPFWPRTLRQNGYYTAHIGKWHTGVDTGAGRDWDHQIVWNRPKYPENAPNYYDNQLISINGGPAKLVKGYSTDNYTDWAIDFINGQNRDQEKPWYLWLCYGAVHGPFTPHERHLNDYANSDIPDPPQIYPPRPNKPKYAQEMEHWEADDNGKPIERKTRSAANTPVGMKDTSGRPLQDWVRQYHQGVRAIDEGVGRLLEALKTSGQDKDTLIVYTSDQGFAWGQQGFKSKVAPYAGTVAAPMIIRPPSRRSTATAGRVVYTPVSGVDIPPTFFSQAGIDLPWKMHGRDLTPLLENRKNQWQHPAMLVHTGKIYGSSTASIPDVNDPRLYHGPGVPWYVMLSQGRYKYVRTLIEGEVEELYDTIADPGEITNLAVQPEYLSTLRTDAAFAKRLPSVGTPL
jgi:arylsulfatase A-like enzyme